jgi:hypothetical protein
VPAPAAARKPAAPKPESVPTVADPERRWDIGAVERAASGNQRRR